MTFNYSSKSQENHNIIKLLKVPLYSNPIATYAYC